MSSLLFLSTMAVAGDATDIGAIINKSMDAVAPVIKEATTSFFKGQKRLNESCDMRECEAPWICYRKQCQECQTGDEKDLVDGLMCKFPKICMPMPHDSSKKGCINPAEWVNCGGHYAASCKACPGGNDKNYCNGDCEWFDPAGSANAPKANLSKTAPVVGTRTENVASGSPVYHTYMSAPPEAVELLPFCRAKATTAAPPEEINCSRDEELEKELGLPLKASDSQICSAKKNCIWVWDGSGLDLATQTAKAPQKDEEEDEADQQKEKNTQPILTEKEPILTEKEPILTEKEPILTEKEPIFKKSKSGKCYVLEKFLDLPGVQTFKKINKQIGNNMDPERRSGSIYDAICDKHSSWRSDAKRGVCEDENELGVTCAWWNTKMFGGRCVVVKETDIKTKSGGTCLIPFYHKDVRYDGCTTAPRGWGKGSTDERAPWCKTDLRMVGKGERFRRIAAAECEADAPISTGKNIDEDELDVSNSRKASCPVAFKLLARHRGTRIDTIKMGGKNDIGSSTELEYCGNKCLEDEKCKSFTIKHAVIYGRNECIRYAEPSKKKEKLEELCFKTDSDAAPAPAAPAPAAKSLSSLKQRTTQSFLAADNWE